MIRNYFKIILRNLWKHKVFTLINIPGLALGLACSLLILLWVQDERSVDAFHKNNPKLFTVYERQFLENKIKAKYATSALLADEIKKVIPDIKYASGYADLTKNVFQVEDKILKEEGNHAGEDFFKMFSYPLLEGTAETALNSPVSIAISRKMAENFFGNPKDAMGKTIRYENRADFKVSAVFENLPKSSKDKFDFIINWYFYKQENSWTSKWSNTGPNTFIMLQDNASPAQVQQKIIRFMDKYLDGDLAGTRIELGMQRFDEMYLHSNIQNGIPEGGRIEYVRLFSIVALFILLIACINFMNLTTARSLKRAKEIGIRKVAGAIRSVLIKQFIGEAVFLTCIAVVFALLIVGLLLPFFNTLTGKQISLPIQSFSFWAMLGGLTVITGLISGSYPALFLSSFKPITVLKGTLKFKTGAIFFRKGLVVFQFVLSIVLIIGTIMISRQVNYIQTKSLGFERENLIYIPQEGELKTQYRQFKERAAQIPGIQNISLISQAPTDIKRGTVSVEWEGKNPDAKIRFTQATVGYDFTKTMQLKFIEGRDFSREFATDSAGFILNESAVKTIGFKDPVGKPITFFGERGSIVGVLKDFHFNSMHEMITPMIIRLRENESFGNILVRIEAGKTKQALTGLTQLCKQMNPSFPFTCQFSDEEYQKLYKSEQMVQSLSNYFAFLAIFISCLGLLGLAMFKTEQRIREIGIRKVLGASTGSLFALLSKEFLQLVLLAMIIASPLAWFAINKWLQDFAYKVDISWWIFLMAAFVALFIALLTISFQAIKAAVANPVKSLRTE